MPINHRLAILDAFGAYFCDRRGPAVGSGLFASLKCQLCQFAYAGNLTTSKITVQVAKVGLQVFKRFLLRPVIGILLQVAASGFRLANRCIWWIPWSWAL